jgi:hypothetical protein
MHTPAPNVVPFPRWLPAADAAQAFGIAERTLRHRAERGQVQRRRDGRAVVYLVNVATPATTPAIAATTPATVATTPATTPATGNPATVADTAAVAALVDALTNAIERAARAELELATVAAELDRVRAVAAELERRLVRRGELLRAALRR